MSPRFIGMIVLVLAGQFATSAKAADLVVSAAASLTNAFTEVGKQFEQLHPGTTIVLNFGGSGQLLQQIAKGAPVDVFASADQETMDQAQSQGLIDAASRYNFVSNALVVVVRKQSRLELSSLRQLTSAEIRHIAIGNPDSVPVGRYSKSVLVVSGQWDTLAPKLINTQNVRQSLDYVARGEVEAAFVYRTDAAILPDKVRIAFEVPTATPILYPIATVKGANSKAEAKGFTDFVRSDAARKIFQIYGFGKP
jgi:molybdate transport system substrate-binding protein